jgi:hypothetical protein
MYLLLYPFFALASLLVSGLTWVLAPLLAVFTKGDGNLPGPLYLFQTFDNTLDMGWIQGSFGDYTTTGVKPTGWTLWYYRFRWLQRNPAYGFDYWPFGAYMDPSQWTVTRNDASWQIYKGPHGLFCIRYMGTSGVGLKLGWKAWAYFNSTTNADGSVTLTPQDAYYSWGPSHRVPICITL